MNPQLRIQFSGMLLNRLHADTKYLRDLAVVLPKHKKPQDCQFAYSETGRRALSTAQFRHLLTQGRDRDEELLHNHIQIGEDRLERGLLRPGSLAGGAWNLPEAIVER
jgi:hypothetical protein